MKKVMVLGAGRGQIPIISLCHKYGWYVIVVSPKGNYPGFKVADKIIYADVTDKETVLSFAKYEKIEAILTDQLDAGVLTAAYVAEKMNLKGITSEVALKFTNKYIMRKEAEKIGVCVPESVCIDNIEDVKYYLNTKPKLKFPLILKPVDSSASCGIYKVNSFDEIKKKFQKTKFYSKSGKIILEQFIKGDEYVVEAFTRQKKVTNLIVGHRDYFKIPNTFIPSATVFLDAQSAKSDLELRLKEINKKLIKGFGLNFGITHGEFIYNKLEDKIYLVEIAARGGGVFISSDLIPAASGVNANDLLVKEVLGIFEEEPILVNKGSSGYFCYLTPKGKVIKLSRLNEVDFVEGVIKSYFDNIELGMITESISNKFSRKGPILVKGNTKEDCYRTINNVKKILDIKIKTNNGIESIIWN